MKTPDPHKVMAANAWPFGAVLVCEECKLREEVTHQQCARYLANGWPKHCDATMTLKAKTTP